MTSTSSRIGKDHCEALLGEGWNVIATMRKPKAEGVEPVATCSTWARPGICATARN